MSKVSSSNQATEEQLHKLISKSYPFHIIKLAEAFINQTLNYAFNESSVETTHEYKVMMSIYHESVNSSLYKIIFDESGPDAMTLKKMIKELYLRKFGPNDTNEKYFLIIKKEIDTLNKKYSQAGKLVIKLRHKVHAHILTVNINEEGTIRFLVDKFSEQIQFLVKDTIRIYIKLLLFYGYFNSPLLSNRDIYSIVKSRMAVIINSAKKNTTD